MPRTAATTDRDLSQTLTATTRLVTPAVVEIFATSYAAGDGVVNAGFDGVAVKGGDVYDASVWVRTTTSQSLTLRLESADGSTVLGTGTIQVAGNDTWQKVGVEMRMVAPCSRASSNVPRG